MKGNPQPSAAANVQLHLEYKCMCALLHEIKHEGTMKKLTVA